MIDGLIEEEGAVGMRCWVLGLGGWVSKYLTVDPTPSVLSLHVQLSASLGFGGLCGGALWRGGWVGELIEEEQE